MKKLFMMALLWLGVTLIGCQSSSKTPKLVVFVSVDQMRSDYVQKFSDFYGEDGFNRLFKEGHWFENCFYEHSCTQTGPGHAALGSAAYAYQTGVFSNVFFNRESEKWQYCVADTTVYLTGKSGKKKYKKGVSPAILKTSGIGDLIKENYPEAKVFGISLKDRAAILMSGKHSNGAYWFDSKTGHFISSSYYSDKIPKWLKKFNTRFMDNFLAEFQTRDWLRKENKKFYDELQGADLREGEADVKYMGKTFPHRIFPDSAKGYSTLKYTPYGDSVLFELFKTTIEKEDLGKDDITDLLCVSYSVMDYIGHTYGPGSHEMMDEVIRLDRIIAGMLHFLDKKIGKNNYIFAMSADHGVLPIPEELRKKGVDAGRVVDSVISLTIEQSINKVTGLKKPGNYWIYPYGGDFVYFKNSFSQLDEPVREKTIQQMKTAVKKIKGVETLYTRQEILNAEHPGKILKRIRYGFYEPGAGDLYVLLKPNYLHSHDVTGTGTGHGSPYDYDAHVPLFFFGKGVPQGITTDTVGPADIGGTIASMLRLKFTRHPDADNIVPR